ncbi:MAG: hypothetical protein QNK89_05835 [Lacinutrix sp.]|uniref:hypothetical protein n=1 Tax=Lacinutrix sp. TaxID=1937692 RepID=UPI0030B58718
MKKIFFILFLLTIGLNVQAQESAEEKASRATQLMSEKVEMEVDIALFTSVSPNTYVSEFPKGVIMAMKVPESYETSKKKINEELISSGKFNVTDRREKTINGVKVLYMEGTSVAEGVTLNNKIYCIEIDDKTCFVFFGMLEVDADAKYAKAITDAAASVIK